mmetsp:Transcript_23997/g.75121  ORF Transcript_23997/g.75121 Transcript_23997/m.75121 type:complete len:200 (+) Transcript_23997:1061-1660(+)
MTSQLPAASLYASTRVRAPGEKVSYTSSAYTNTGRATSKVSCSTPAPPRSGDHALEEEPYPGTSGGPRAEAAKRLKPGLPSLTYSLEKPARAAAYCPASPPWASGGKSAMVTWRTARNTVAPRRSRSSKAMATCLAALGRPCSRTVLTSSPGDGSSVKRTCSTPPRVTTRAPSSGIRNCEISRTTTASVSMRSPSREGE